MIGIETIAHYLPQGRISNFDRAAQFGLKDDFITQKLGVPCVIRKSDDEDTSDLCLGAFEALKKRAQVAEEKIDCLIVCTQNPDKEGLPHTSAIVHGKMGLPEKVAAFDVSLGCSGYVYCLSIAMSFMNSQGLQKGLLFTADPYSKIVDPSDKNTSLLFSDAATVTLLGTDPVYELVGTEFGTKGSEYKNLRTVNGHLQMNGRAIFNFTMTAVPSQIRRVVENAGRKLEQIDLFLLHQASKYVIDMMGEQMKLDPEKVPSNLAQVGNTVSSSIPLLLEQYLTRPEFREIVICGFGVGLSWATAILKRLRER